jgi:hypothetical protein
MLLCWHPIWLVEVKKLSVVISKTSSKSVIRLLVIIIGVASMATDEVNIICFVFFQLIII